MGIDYLNDEEYARRSLVDTIVMNNNKEFVYINNITKGMQANITKNGKIKTVTIKEDLDLRPTNIGYIKDGNNARYIVRRSTRQWRQGIVLNTCLECEDGRMQDLYLDGTLHLFRLIETTPYSKTLREGINCLKSYKGEVVINRDVKIGKDFSLHYKGFNVGKVFKKKDVKNYPSFTIKKQYRTIELINIFKGIRS